MTNDLSFNRCYFLLSGAMTNFTIPDITCVKHLLAVVIVKMVAVDIKKAGQEKYHLSSRDSALKNGQNAFEFCENLEFVSNHPTFPVKSVQQHFYVRRV